VLLINHKTIETVDKQLKQNVLNALEEIRPFLQNDGGDISLLDIDEEEQTVKVQLEGQCATCTINQMTLKAGVEFTVRKHAPQIQRVINIEN